MTTTPAWVGKVGNFGSVMSAGSFIPGLVGGYFESKFKQNQLKSQALEFEHQQYMAKINAKSIESQAQHIARQYNKQAQLKSLQQGQQQGQRRASMGARGGVAGYGSSRDVEVSQEVLNEIDRLTINVNKVKAVGNMRLQGVQANIQSDMLGVSAGNMFASASSVSPFLNMSSSLLTGAGTAALTYAKSKGYKIGG